MKTNNQNGFTVIIGVLLLLVVVGVIGVGLFMRSKNADKNETQGSQTDPKLGVVSDSELQNPVKFVEHEFVDLGSIYSISKFRSAEGHDFTDGTESCRSMKHYFNQQFDEAVSKATQQNNGMPLQPDGKTDVPIYAPADGVISAVETERMPIGEQLYFVPDKAKDYTVRLFHVYKSNGISRGTHVTAGQQIGVISKGQNTDIAVELKGHYVSYFQVMKEEVFAAYADRGLTSREEVILSKAYRDAHPVPCDQSKTGNQRFTYPEGYDHANDIVRLSGYIDPATFGHYETNQNKQ